MTNFTTYLHESMSRGEEDIIELITYLYKSKHTMESLNDKYSYDTKSMVKNINRMVDEIEKLYKDQFPDRNLKNKLFF